ncbi:hypothetical protein AYO40_06025 [Planctomycetaceae bacterium SCGC AG-212-D15]|nr:hypothetical protein AYO40_06025 [Planctomycetaceae bacterium SCGC AG-212-D15]
MGAFALCCLLLGCGSVPRNPAPEIPVREEIRLFDHEVAARSDAIEREVLDHVPPRIPADNAKAVLKANGFVCQNSNWFSEPSLPSEVIGNMVRRGRYGATDTKERKSGLRAVACTNRKDVHGSSCVQSSWGREYETVLVLLHVDKAEIVQTVDVYAHRSRHPCCDFFQKHPDLREPVGIPLDQALANMQANGFQCKPVDGDGCPYTLCEAYSEWALGGTVIRVKLLTDQAGFVRDSEILRTGEMFDGERCMLPNPDDSRAQAWCKGAVFPLREATRITVFTTLYTLAFTMWCMSHGAV